MVLPDEIERHITNDFQKNSIESMTADPFNCLFFTCCQPCAIYAQRQEIIELTGEPYVCCGGIWPYCGFEKPAPNRNWLIAEACCCTGLALAGNRVLVQTRLNRRNSDIDNAVKICNECVTCEFWMFRHCMECSKEREIICKAACCVCPCTHCQNGITLAEVKTSKDPYNGPATGLIEELPVHFTNAGLRKPAEAPTQMAPM